MSKALEEQAAFPRQLKAEREQRGWSQARVAELLVTDAKTVSRWERGVATPAPYLREKLCALFDKSLQAFGLFDHEGPFFSSRLLLDPLIPLPPSFPLIGREKELTTLRQHLYQSNNSAVCALNGLPGVGKTALSIALAHDPELRAHFKDGILWAGLGPDPDLLSHVNRWATLLGISPGDLVDLTDINAWLVALHQAVASRAMLLVIDDVWCSEDALALQIGGPLCAHIMTTRFPAIASQLAFERATAIDELTTEDGVLLLHMLAPMVAEQAGEQVRELVEVVGGLPLALTLIGNHLRIQSYTRPQRIVTTLQLLRDAAVRLNLTEPRSASERHASQFSAALISLRSIIAVTDKQLDEEARRALYALSSFPTKPNSFSEEAALHVADCSLDILDLLLESGLLQMNGAHRYLLHPTIADYACWQLEYSGAFDAAYKRLIAYFTAFVETHSTDYAQLEVESKNILAALEAAFTLDGVTELPRLACACTPFLFSRGQSALAEQHLLHAYEAASFVQDRAGQMDALTMLEQVRQKQAAILERSHKYGAG